MNGPASNASLSNAVTDDAVKKRGQERDTRRVCGLALGALMMPVGFATGCGSSSDLIIGSDTIAVTSGAGGASAGNAAAGGRVSSSGGSSTGSGGTIEGGAAGSQGDAGAGELDCDPSDLAPAGSLLHRYAFEGTGAVATDSVGAADGQLITAVPSIPTDNDCKTRVAAGPGATLDGNGRLVLDGCRGYVDLPNHLISVLTDVTVMVWATAAPGAAAYGRYFDFGVGTGEDDTTSAQGSTFLAVSVAGNAPSQLQLLARSAPGAAIDQIVTTVKVNDNREHQITAVFAGNSYAELYLDGVRQSSRIPITWPLSNINDVNDWLGRSQWPSDHPFSGSFDEVRIYGRALSRCAVRALYVAGADFP